MTDTDPMHPPHGLGTIVGYNVRRTFFDDTPHKIEATFSSPYAYAEALEAARAIRNEPGYKCWAVVDMVYACGCTGASLRRE